MIVDYSIFRPTVKVLKDTGVTAVGLLVVTLAGRQVAALTRFDNAVMPRFGFPRSLPDAGTRAQA